MREIESAIIRFSGDSGDGMQLVGTQFSNTSAAMGNDISTFPDFPAEIRAPAGTVPGVSGFQINISSNPVYTPGDAPDVLVAMNPAALRANIESLKRGATIILNKDTFDLINLKKAGYQQSPLETGELDSYQIIEAPISSQTLKILKDTSLDNKTKMRCKNFYALGMIYFMYGRSLGPTIKWLDKTFRKRPEIGQANISTLKSGHYFAETLESSISTYKIPAAKISPGIYRHINGNTAVAFGLMQASEAAGLDLFLGSYPITPATDILHELAKYKHFGVKTFQAEDEISAICSAIGASFAGALAATTTSGPGIALKSEAMGLAVILELPLVIVNIQRGGPSTGLPTKTEQSDLNLVLYGRNGEAPLIILAADSPSDCFHMAYEASRLALEHMTPVVLLSDGYLANGAEPWKIPLQQELSPIKTQKIDPNNYNEEAPFLPYKRDSKTLVRRWATPGMKNLEHRIGGLEKDFLSGNISYDPLNHEKMCFIRKEKIERVAEKIPEQKIIGEDSGELLVISWGGTYGANYSAVRNLQKEGKKISLCHIKYISPLPKNLGKIIKNFKQILITELNGGQMKDLINCNFECHAKSYTKIQGLPFKISELMEVFNKYLEKVH